MPLDRHIVSEQERQNEAAAAAAAAAAATFTSGGGRVYHNYKNPDMMIPLQRPNTNTNIGIHGHKKFGMRAMFM